MTTEKTPAGTPTAPTTPSTGSDVKTSPTPPANVVELIRALERSGTGRDKLNTAVGAVEEWKTKFHELPTVEKFYEYVRGDANVTPPRPALLPPGTLGKIKALMDTGDALPAGGVDAGALEYSARLAALEGPHATDAGAALPAPGAPGRPPGASAASSVPREKGGTEGEYIEDRSRAATVPAAGTPSTQSGPRIEKAVKDVK